MPVFIIAIPAGPLWVIGAAVVGNLVVNVGKYRSLLRLEKKL